jgi:hypothetical protein
MSHYAWMDQARCAETDPDLWIRDAKGGDSVTPKRICADCPVRRQCEAHAETLHRFDGLAMRGIWGGLSHRQRAQPHQIGEAA